MEFIGAPRRRLRLRRRRHRPPPPPLKPPLLRLEAPRLLELRALAPLLAPLNALPDEEGRLAEGLDLDCEALGDGLGRLALGDAVGRLADGVPVEGRAAALPVEGRAPAVPVEGRAPAVAGGRTGAPTLPVEGPAPPEPQPRASAAAGRVAALGEPLLLSRLWSGCHFCRAAAWAGFPGRAVAPVAAARSFPGCSRWHSG